MKQIPMTITQLESWTMQYGGDRAGIFYDGDHLNVPDDLYDAIAAINTSVSPLKAQLKAYAASKRFLVETGGVTVSGAKIDTSRDSQAMVANAYAYVTNAGATTVQYKATSGWVALTDVEIKAIALAVGAHVQACFAVEKSVDDAIEAGTISDTAGIDAASWPANN